MLHLILGQSPASFARQTAFNSLVVTFVIVFKALVIIEEVGFELRLATAIIMPCSAFWCHCCFVNDKALATPFQWAIGFISAITRWCGVIGLSPVM